MRPRYFLFASPLILLGLNACRAPAKHPRPYTSPIVEPMPLFPTTQPSAHDLDGVSLNVALTESPVTRDRPVKVTVTLANALDDPLWLPLRRQPERDFFATVTRDDSGAPAPLTPAGVALFQPRKTDSAGIVLLDIPKGDPREVTLNLSAIYDLSMPGKYTVVVQVHVFQRGHRDIVFPVTSPPFQFEVPATSH